MVNNPRVTTNMHQILGRCKSPAQARQVKNFGALPGIRGSYVPFGRAGLPGQGPTWFSIGSMGPVQVADCATLLSLDAAEQPDSSVKQSTTTEKAKSDSSHWSGKNQSPIQALTPGAWQYTTTSLVSRRTPGRIVGWGPREVMKGLTISLAHDYGMNLILWVLHVTVLANPHVSLSPHTLRLLQRPSHWIMYRLRPLSRAQNVPVLSLRPLVSFGVLRTDLDAFLLRLRNAHMGLCSQFKINLSNVPRMPQSVGGIPMESGIRRS